MLSHETMGMACLAVLWVVALLVALAASQDVRDLLRLRARLRPLAPGQTGFGMIEGTIAEGLGEGDTLAVHTIEQVGRAVDGSTPALKFHDRAHASRVVGGVLDAEGGPVRIPAEGRNVAVWTLASAKELAARAPSDDALLAAFDTARTAKGFARTVTTTLASGARVFVAGDVARRGGELVVGPSDEGVVLVAALDPRAFVDRRCLLAVAFILLELAACALATLIATRPPLFGRTSIIGALLCIAFFLGVTPIGVAIRDACRTPDETRLRGLWVAKRRP